MLKIKQNQKIMAKKSIKKTNMKSQKFWGIQATTEKGEKALAYQQGKHLFFCITKGGRKFLPSPPPTLFLTKKLAQEALNNRGSASKKALEKKFNTIVECLKHDIVSVQLSLN